MHLGVSWGRDEERPPSESGRSHAAQLHFAATRLLEQKASSQSVEKRPRITSIMLYD